MASVNSRAELFPNRAFTPISGSGEAMGDDPEWQARMLLKSRHRSSYENMNGQGPHEFTDDTSHQYEDPGRLAQGPSFHGRSQRSQGRPLPSKPIPRRKQNEAYESVHSKRRKRTYTDESNDLDGYHRRTCSQLMKILSFVAFFCALAAVVMILFVLLGVLSVPGCHECKKELVPGSAEASGSTRELWRVVKELRNNMSVLQAAVRRKDEIITLLQRRDAENADRIDQLERKAMHRVFVANGTNFNISQLVGPKGAPGIRGPPGEKGAKGEDGKQGERGPGNMTLCLYEVSESSSFTADERGNGNNVVIVEPKGHRIVGVSCSTYGTTEYNLKSQLIDNSRQYECECRGRSTLFPINGAKSGKSRCYIHYWICPLIS